MLGEEDRYKFASWELQLNTPFTLNELNIQIFIN